MTHVIPSNHVAAASLNSSFDPGDLAGSDLRVWIDYTDSASLTMNGGNIQAAMDKSGNGNNAIQLSGARQPRLDAGIIGGKQAAFFKYGGATTQWMTIANNASVQTKRLHLFAVIQRFADTGSDEYFAYKTTGGNQSWEFRVHSTDILLATVSVDGTVTIAPGTGPALAVGTPYIVELVFDGTKGRVIRNNVTGSASALVGDINTNNVDITLGGPNFSSNGLYGYLTEFLMFANPQQGLERASVLAYLSSKYGIAV